MKKKIALLLAAVMIFTILPMNVFAAPGDPTEDKPVVLSNESEEPTVKGDILGSAAAGGRGTSTLKLYSPAVGEDERIIFDVLLSGADWYYDKDDEDWPADWDLGFPASVTKHSAKNFTRTYDGTFGTNQTYTVEIIVEDLIAAPNRARVIVTSTGTAGIALGSILEIPVVAKVTADKGQVTVSQVLVIDYQDDGFISMSDEKKEFGDLWSTGTRWNLLLAPIAGEGRTRVRPMGSVTTGKYVFSFSSIIIEELVPASFKTSAGDGSADGSNLAAFYIDLPADFYFAGDPEMKAPTGGMVIDALAEVVIVDNGEPDTKGYRKNGRLLVTMPENITHSMLNSFAITGVIAVSIYGDIGEFSVTISNASTGDKEFWQDGDEFNGGNALWLKSAGMTKETIKIGNRLDWSMNFSRAGDQPAGADAIPNLYTGRYDLAKQAVLDDGLSPVAFFSGSLDDEFTDYELGSTLTGSTNVYDEEALFEDYLTSDGDLRLTDLDDDEDDIAEYSASNRTARVSLSEEVINAWDSSTSKETIFTLPEGVKFLRVDLVNPEGLSDNELADEYSFYNQGKTPYVIDWDGNSLLGNVAILNDQEFQIINWERIADEHVVLEFDIWVSIDPEFAPADGSKVPVELTLSGDAINGGMPDPVIIATAQRPITIETKLTEVAIGFQKIPTADITITEVAAGVLREGTELRLNVQGPATGGVSLSEASPEVAEGDLEITESDDWWGFTIDEESSEASAIELTGVAIEVNRFAVFSNDAPYSMRFYGNSIIRNQADGSDLNETGLFATKRFSIPYYRIASEAPNPMMAEIRVGEGRNYYTVNGQQFAMDASAYIDNGVMMVPARFVAYALGIGEDNIIWDGVERKVYIRSTSATVIFEIDSDYMTVNGVRLPMVNNGVSATAQIRGGRTYIPFRQIGVAFGIKVDYDAETREAIYNPQNS